MSSLGIGDVRPAERRWTIIGVAIVGAILLVQVLGGLVREATTDEPSRLDMVQTCLRERATPYERVAADPVALSAERGAVRTSVQGNGVTVSLGGSEKDAERVYDAYTAVGTADVESRLELRRKVVFLWDEPPTAAQRAFMILCTLDAQD